MLVDAAATGLVVLAAVISWLQTKIDISVRRHDGGWEFDFRLHKEPVPTSVLRQLADTVTRMISGPDEPRP